MKNPKGQAMKKDDCAPDFEFTLDSVAIDGGTQTMITGVRIHPRVWRRLVMIAATAPQCTTEGAIDGERSKHAAIVGEAARRFADALLAAMEGES